MKPLLRGHFHQAAFLIALGACSMLISSTRSTLALKAALIYSLTLCLLFGVSALYHRIDWSKNARAWMRRIDHAAIFVLIAGTGTPIFEIAFPAPEGTILLKLIWIFAVIGSLLSLVWVKAPKWLATLLYMAMGWYFIPHVLGAHHSLPKASVQLLETGGIIYTLGAIAYATKHPNPWPKIFGYHEIFHVLVVLGAICHFVVVMRLVRA